MVGRYYDPSTDQCLSVDPDLMETGQPYAFTGDDPLNATDPLGLKKRHLSKTQQRKVISAYINAGRTIVRNTAKSSLFHDMVWVDNHRGPIMLGANVLSIGLTRMFR